MVVLVHQRRQRVGEQRVIRLGHRARLPPLRVVEIHLLKIGFGGPGVVAFEKLRVVAGRAHIAIAAVCLAAELLVAGHMHPAVNDDIAEKAMAVVATDPHAIDQALVVAVHGQYIPPGPHIRRDVNRVIQIVTRITRRRPLPNKLAIDIHFRIVVRTEKHYRRARLPRQRKVAPKKDVPVANAILNTRPRRAVQLAVVDVLPRQGQKFTGGDPRARKTMFGSALHKRRRRTMLLYHGWFAHSWEKDDY